MSVALYCLKPKAAIQKIVIDSILFTFRRRRKRKIKSKKKKPKKIRRKSLSELTNYVSKFHHCRGDITHNCHLLLTRH